MIQKAILEFCLRILTSHYFDILKLFIVLDCLLTFLNVTMYSLLKNADNSI